MALRLARRALILVGMLLKLVSRALRLARRALRMYDAQSVKGNKKSTFCLFSTIQLIFLNIQFYQTNSQFCVLDPFWSYFCSILVVVGLYSIPVLKNMLLTDSFRLKKQFYYQTMIFGTLKSHLAS